MHWTYKAKIQKVCAAAPKGDFLYRQLQKRLGNLTSSPFKRITTHTEMLAGLNHIGVDVRGAHCLEVGTGHVPTLPVGFFLAGADSVATVDLHRRLDLAVTADMLRTIVAERQRVVDAYQSVVADPDLLHDRLDFVERLADQPAAFLEQAGIRYTAPGDASRMPEPDSSFDLHFSVTVLEHVEPSALRQLLGEGRRLLRPDGVAVHFIDPSDHFSHGTADITPINFLQFSEPRWEKIAGNEFAYHNRLRASQFEQAFDLAGLRIVHRDGIVDRESLTELDAGFPLDAAFARFSPEELATITFRLYARPLPQ